MSKHKKRFDLDLAAAKPSEDELADLLLGPTGNLRAPTLRRGKTLIVGFDPAMYAEELG